MRAYGRIVSSFTQYRVTTCTAMMKYIKKSFVEK